MDSTNREVPAQQISAQRRRYGDGFERDEVRLIVELIRSDLFRMKVLERVRRLHLAVKVAKVKNSDSTRQRIEHKAAHRAPGRPPVTSDAMPEAERRRL